MAVYILFDIHNLAIVSAHNRARTEEEAQREDCGDSKYKPYGRFELNFFHNEHLILIF
ncbi:hypothetical protein KL86CLO1_11447 [uncultured Eubacteriales bacterium]|uniref:Uncharacterized protein n=1 Tax=uncultured Eubacteriales bacterium TaxID=172733 RepID=A0A212JPH2_9FIRM|nr:hypothetical protein KL86CLO1_11447 [uncultured Eubacteriales bacterium]